MSEFDKWNFLSEDKEGYPLKEILWAKIQIGVDLMKREFFEKYPEEDLEGVTSVGLELQMWRD